MYTRACKMLLQLIPQRRSRSWWFWPLLILNNNAASCAWTLISWPSCKMSPVIGKRILRSLSLSYQKKDWRAGSFFGYDTDYKIVFCCLQRLYSDKKKKLPPVFIFFPPPTREKNPCQASSTIEYSECYLKGAVHDRNSHEFLSQIYLKKQ